MFLYPFSFIKDKFLFKSAFILNKLALKALHPLVCLPMLVLYLEPPLLVLFELHLVHLQPPLLNQLLLLLDEGDAFQALMLQLLLLFQVGQAGVFHLLEEQGAGLELRVFPEQGVKGPHSLSSRCRTPILYFYQLPGFLSGLFDLLESFILLHLEHLDPVVELLHVSLHYLPLLPRLVQCDACEFGKLARTEGGIPSFRREGVGSGIQVVWVASLGGKLLIGSQAVLLLFNLLLIRKHGFFKC